MPHAFEVNVNASIQPRAGLSLMNEYCRWDLTVQSHACYGGDQADFKAYGTDVSWISWLVKFKLSVFN